MSGSANGVFDSAEPFDYFFVVSERIYVMVQLAFWIRFHEFSAPATAAASGGGATSGSGGSSAPTSDASSSSTSGTQNGIVLTLGLHDHVAAGQYTVRADQTEIQHDHDILHTHTVAVPAHDHSTPAHTHDLTYGIFKEAMPGSINVNVGLWRKPLAGGSWTLLGSISGLDETEQWVNMESLLPASDPSGLYRLTFLSAAGQPNDGRLAVDVAHDAWGAIQSA